MMYDKLFSRRIALLPLFLLLLGAAGAQSQTSMEVEVTVVDDRQQPLADARVQLLELATHQQLEQSSDGRGIAQFRLSKPGEYQVSVNDQVQSSDPVLVRANQKGSTSLYLTYNPALQQRTRRQTFDRSGLTDIMVQGQVAPEDVADGYNRIEIEVVNSARVRQAGKRVCLVSLVRRKRYVAVTDAAGMAYFHLPGKTAYDIDVEEQLNASFVVQEELEGYTLSQTVVYDQYDLTETRRNDTVQQQIRMPLENRNSRAVYRIKVRREGKPWPNGLVFLDEIHARTVYKARTDAKGEAVFILPFGKKFLVHFPYERDVDVVNLIDARNIASGSLDLTYTPNPALEHPERFVPTPAQLMLTEFPYYHRTPYPAPPGTRPSPLLLRGGGIRPEAVLEIGVSARETDNALRPPLNLAFVLDISGSMAGYERIESLKRGFIALLGKLRPQDVLSITLFNDHPRLLLPAQPLGRDRDRIVALIQGIEPSGGTDMKQALEIGYTQAMRHYRPGGANTLVLLSDGYDINPVDTLLAAQAPWNDRVSCTAIGVGNDYNYDLLKRLVSRGADLLQQAHEGAELELLFSEKLITAAAPSMRDIRIEVRTGPSLTLRQTYGLRNVVPVAGGFNATLPDLFPGQELPCLASFVRGADGSPSASRVTVTISYLDVASGRREQRTEQWSLGAESNTDAAGAEEHRKMYAVAFANDCLLRMARSFEQKHWNECRRALEEGQAKLKALYTGAGDADIQALAGKFQLYATALKHIAYRQKIGD